MIKETTILATRTDTTAEYFPPVRSLLTGNPLINLTSNHGAQILKIAEINELNLLPLALKSEEWLKKFPGVLSIKGDVYRKDEVPHFMRYPLDPMFREIGHSLPKTVDGYVYEIQQKTRTIEIPQFDGNSKAVYVNLAFPAIDATRVEQPTQLPNTDPPIFWHQPMTGREKKDVALLIDNFARTIIDLRTGTSLRDRSGRVVEFQDIVSGLQATSNPNREDPLVLALARAKKRFVENTDKVALQAKKVADNLLKYHQAPKADRQRLQIVIHSLMSFWPALLLVHYKRTYNDPTTKILQRIASE